jgi:heat shock protein HslJ
MKLQHLAWGVMLLLTVQAQTPPSVSDLAGTNWTLQSYGPENTQQTVLPEAPITLEFDEAGAGIGGSSGCNSYGSTITLDGNNVTLTPPISTMKACAEPIMRQEQGFFTALTSVTTLEQTEGQLILSGGGQRLVFVSAQSESPENTTLEGTAWRLQRFTKGSALVENAPITLEFRTDGGLGGSAGCNTYRGNVTLQGNTLNVSPLATTRKACTEDVMAQETMYLRSLKNAITFERTGDTLTLFAGEEGLEFVLAQTDSSTDFTTPPTINDTATSDITITSSNELNVATLGTSNPLELALALLDIPDAPSVHILREDTSPTESVITLIAEGLEDDSVAATLTRLTFTRSEDGNWSLMSGLEAVKCRRGEDTTTFVAGPCP